jgi:hypothetical protein
LVTISQAQHSQSCRLWLQPQLRPLILLLPQPPQRHIRDSPPLVLRFQIARMMKMTGGTTRGFQQQCHSIRDTCRSASILSRGEPGIWTMGFLARAGTTDRTSSYAPRSTVGLGAGRGLSTVTTIQSRRPLEETKNSVDLLGDKVVRIDPCRSESKRDTKSPQDQQPP